MTWGLIRCAPPHLFFACCRRTGYICFIVLIAAIKLFIHQKVLRDRTTQSNLAAQLRWCAVKVGGAWIKLGQILATRHDLFEPEAIELLAQLQDRMPPVPFDQIKRVLLRSLPPILLQLENIAETPLATGSIAQIHFAKSTEFGPLALKVKKPGIEGLIRLDITIVRAIARVVSILPTFHRLPVIETVDIVCDAVWKQTDFCLEASNTEKLRVLFNESTNVRFAKVRGELCSSDIIAMEYEGGLRRLDDISIPLNRHRHIIEESLRAVYEMLFFHGLVHCDVHAGNILYRECGDVMFLDCGLVVAIDKDDREDFADFFMCISLNRGERAADLILRKALFVPNDVKSNQFKDATAGLINSVSGLTAKNFTVAAFVVSLFKIQRHFGVKGSAAFTWMALVLLTFEGVVRGKHPEIDFQRIAIELVLKHRTGICT
jgi:ubiquinone biosynthesis protein